MRKKTINQIDYNLGEALHQKGLFNRMKRETLKKQKKDPRKIDRIVHLLSFSMIVTWNIMFNLFVWMPSDLSPNIAFAFTSLLILIPITWRMFGR